MKNTGKDSKQSTIIRKSLPISRLFPNIVTLIGLCVGLSSIRFALLGKWEMAITFILLAAVIDGMDGRLARLLKATSNFGAHLDSFADFINFGVAPVLILYLWRVNETPIHGLGWAMVLFFSICCAVRLARFNTDIENDELPQWMDGFFIGIPAPLGATLVILPMMLKFQFGSGFFEVPEYLCIYIAIIALLMASRIPTISIKKVAIRREYASFTLVLAGLLITALIIEPWIILPALGILYALSIPVTCIYFYRLKQEETEKET